MQKGNEMKMNEFQLAYPKGTLVDIYDRKSGEIMYEGFIEGYKNTNNDSIVLIHDVTGSIMEIDITSKSPYVIEYYSDINSNKTEDAPPTTEENEATMKSVKLSEIGFMNRFENAVQIQDDQERTGTVKGAYVEIEGNQDYIEVDFNGEIEMVPIYKIKDIFTAEHCKQMNAFPIGSKVVYDMPGGEGTVVGYYTFSKSLKLQVDNGNGVGSWSLDGVKVLNESKEFKSGDEVCYETGDIGIVSSTTYIHGRLHLLVDVDNNRRTWAIEKTELLARSTEMPKGNETDESEKAIPEAKSENDEMIERADRLLKVKRENPKMSWTKAYEESVILRQYGYKVRRSDYFKSQLSSDEQSWILKPAKSFQ